VVAVKILTRMGSFQGDSPEACRERAAFGKEVTLLSKLRHPQVVTFIGAASPEWSATPLDKYCILSEFMSGGSLFDRIHGVDGRGQRWLKSVDARYLHQMSRDTACGMAFLHSKGFIHRDLKSRNLLTDDAFRVKVADFGLSRLRQSTMEDPSSTLSGTPAWMAPELMRGSKYGPPVDVYSYGMVLFELVTGEVPFETAYGRDGKRDIHPARIVFDVVKNAKRPQLPGYLTKPLARLMERCWAQAAAERPTFDEILMELDAPGAAETLFEFCTAQEPCQAGSAEEVPQHQIPGAWDDSDASKSPADATPRDGSAARLSLGSTNPPGASSPEATRDGGFREQKPHERRIRGTRMSQQPDAKGSCTIS